jgi:hypothetical protein
VVEHIGCGERPYVFVTYIHDATSCDEANPLGAAACEVDPPLRTAPLSLEGLDGAD